MAGWGGELADGRAQGIAVNEGFGSICAQVAEVTLQNGNARVHKVYCAVDCGLAVNPSIIRSQIEGAIAFGLSAVIKGEINIEKGRVKQSNFHNFQILGLDEMPEVEVDILASSDYPGGIGEIGVPPVAPAVCNAIFKLTGKRIRRIPIDKKLLA